MTTIAMTKKFLAYAQHHQEHFEKGTQDYEEWGQRVGIWQQRLLQLEVGYLGGCPHSIVHDEEPAHGDL